MSWNPSVSPDQLAKGQIFLARGILNARLARSRSSMSAMIIVIVGFGLQPYITDGSGRYSKDSLELMFDFLVRTSTTPMLYRAFSKLLAVTVYEVLEKPK